MPVLMFINLKGGVAKTTNAVAVSRFLTELGNRVLLIDADHQCAAGELLLGDRQMDRCERQRSTLHDLLIDFTKVDFDVETVENHIVPANSGQGEACRLCVLPGSLRIDDFQINYHRARKEFQSSDEFLSVIRSRARNFKNWLIANFDYTIIDCPPSLAIQVQMLIKVADAYVVPCIPDNLSIRGACYLVDRLRKKHSRITGLGTIWSIYRCQIDEHEINIKKARRRKGRFARIPRPFDTVIPNATAIVRATESSDSSLTANYTSLVANRYRALVREIVNRCHMLGADIQQQNSLQTAIAT